MAIINKRIVKEKQFHYYKTQVPNQNFSALHFSICDRCNNFEICKN